MSKNKTSNILDFSNEGFYKSFQVLRGCQAKREEGKLEGEKF